jgi:hypothetical protein
VWLGCCLDDRPSTLRPFLSDPYGRGRRRYNRETLRGRSHIYLPAAEFCGSAISAFRPGIATPGIRADDADLRFSEHQAGSPWAWVGIRGHSKKAIDGLDIIRSYEVSWHSSDLRVKSKQLVRASGRKGVEQATLLQFLPEGEAMTNLATVVQQLRKERDQAQKRIDQLDQTLEALTGVGGIRGTSGRRRRVNASATRRTMSAAARKRIAAAQRALGDVESRAKKEVIQIYP